MAVPGFTLNKLFASQFLAANANAPLKLAANRSRTVAKAIAPYDPENAPPHYRDQFTVVEEDGQVRLGNRSAIAHILEWGTVDTPAFATLRRAVEVAGYRFREQDKT